MKYPIQSNTCNTYDKSASIFNPLNDPTWLIQLRYSVLTHGRARITRTTIRDYLI